MEDISHRLQQARRAAGYASAAEAAERFGWRPPTYSAHENGSRGVRREKAELYASAFRVSPEWLLFGRLEDTSKVPAPTDSSTEMINVYNVKASAGFGMVVEGEELVEQLTFPRGYLSTITKSNPRDLAIIGVKGDSMLPTLNDDDVVMIDTAKRDLSFDGLFVLRFGDALHVKRVGRSPVQGHVMVMSDNKVEYPTLEYKAADIFVIGKVIWYGRKV